MLGLVTPETVSLRAYSNTGEVAMFEPGPIIDVIGQEWRGFVVGLAGGQSAIRVETLDASGQVISVGNHPNPENAVLE